MLRVWCDLSLSLEVVCCVFCKWIFLNKVWFDLLHTHTQRERERHPKHISGIRVNNLAITVEFCFACLSLVQVRGRMLSTTTAIIHWDGPEEANGQVVGYRVYYTDDNTLQVNQVSGVCVCGGGSVCVSISTLFTPSSPLSISQLTTHTHTHSERERERENRYRSVFFELLI